MVGRTGIFAVSVAILPRTDPAQPLLRAVLIHKTRAALIVTTISMKKIQHTAMHAVAAIDRVEKHLVLESIPVWETMPVAMILLNEGRSIIYVSGKAAPLPVAILLQINGPPEYIGT